MVNTAIFTVVLPLVSVAMILGFVRLLKGPTLTDRIIAFDMVALSAVGIIVAATIVTNQPSLLDVATVWAIIAFLSTIAFAYYIGRWRGKP